MNPLEATRRLVMEPSSNLPQEQDASWLYLLHESGTVVCVGAPSAEVQAYLRGVSSRVEIITKPRLDMSTRIDAVIVASNDRGLVAGIMDELRPLIDDATAVVQLPGSAPVGTDREWVAAGRPPVEPLWARRLRRLGRLGLAKLSAAVARPALESARRHASEVDFITIPDDVRSAPDPALISVGYHEIELPRYLVQMSRAAGYELTSPSWAFGPPRGFASQKVVFLVRDSGGAPDLVVKMTQHARFNERLQAEADALVRWADTADSFVTPRSLFVGNHHDRLVLAQSALSGLPFRSVAEPAPAGMAIQAGYRAVIDLAQRSVQATADGAMADALARVVDDLRAIYQPPTEVRQALDAAVERLRDTNLPTVFMHGDLGVWNLLVDESSPIGILDWENADPLGVPLWDLFVYARTVGVFLADVRGIRYTASTFRKQLLSDSELQRDLFERIREYRRHVEIPEAVVDDVFLLCWVQQAVREAAGLADPTWQSARSTRWVAATIEQPLGFYD